MVSIKLESLKLRVLIISEKMILFLANEENIHEEHEMAKFCTFISKLNEAIHERGKIHIKLHKKSTILKRLCISDISQKSEFKK